MKCKTLTFILIAALLPALLLCSCSQDDTVSIDTYNLMYTHLSQVWAQSLAHADATTAFFGDSRVAGADWYSAYPDSKVVNLGIGGDKVGNLLARMCQISTLAENGRLECVFLAIGGNDCMSKSYDSSVFRSEYETLLSAMQAPGLTVYVNTIAGVTDEGTTLSSETAKLVNGRIAQANEIIKELAASHGMTLIDIASAMNNTDGKLKAIYSTPDGVHFSESGYAVWYEVLRPFIPID